MRLRNLAYPLLCSGIFLFAVLLIWPVVESGVADDWSIVRTAQLLAETGHIHYNGWEAPMLGWPLYVAALAFRVFGYSFTAARITTILEGAVTVFLMHRILIRSGVRTWNSLVGTLTLALTPIFLLGCITFATDGPGLLAVLVCLYSCLRALQSKDEFSAAAWICFAALANTGLGTARQIAWLGVIVMVPSTLWLLRHRRRVLIAGTACWLLSLALVREALLWLKRQPYVLPEHLMLHQLHLGLLPSAIKTLTRITLDVVLLVLPVALAHLLTLRRVEKSDRLRLALVAGLLPLTLLVLIERVQGNHLAPFLLFPSVTQTAENTFTSFPMPAMGPPILPPELGIRLLVTVATIIGLIAVLASTAIRNRKPVPTNEVLPWPSLLILTVPFALAYLAALMPRAIFIFTVDRYLLFLLPITLLLLLRLYQARVGPRLPLLCLLPLALLGVYSVTTLHDLFATYRANLAAVDELRAAGIPRTSINGGLEYNSTTELLASPFLHAAGIRLADGSFDGGPRFTIPGPCSQIHIELMPVIHPIYAIASPASPCEKVVAFASIHFHTWLPPNHRELDIVRYVPSTVQEP